jgi:iron(II)-dependent oxidoreductase
VIEPDWILIQAGTCLFGDDARPVRVAALWWTAAPITIGQLEEPCGDPHVPATGLTQGEAADLAAYLGGRLPRSAEWEYMAAGPDRRRFPWGDQDWNPDRAALADARHTGPVPVSRHRAGATPDGVQDVAGNVWEWTASAVMGGGGFVIRGGSYASQPLYARCTFLNAAPAELRSPGIGFRVVRPA